MKTRLICEQGRWYVYVAGPFGTREAAEQAQRDLDREERQKLRSGVNDPAINPFVV